MNIPTVKAEFVAFFLEKKVQYADRRNMLAMEFERDIADRHKRYAQNLRDLEVDFHETLRKAWANRPADVQPSDVGDMIEEVS